MNKKHTMGSVFKELESAVETKYEKSFIIYYCYVIYFTFICSKVWNIKKINK